jgi:hypothetical protein
MELIFGLDNERNDLTALEVRDALITCFYEAHEKDASESMGGTQLDKSYFSQLVHKSFTQTGGDFENPTKKSLIDAISALAEFAANFRDKTIVEKHYSQMMKLINNLN